MYIEEKIFKRCKLNLDKLTTYGFKKKKDKYEYSCNFCNDDFKAYFSVSMHGDVTGKVYDLEMDDEYTLFRIDANHGEYVTKVREEYKKLLMDIKDKCFDKELFIGNQSNRITKYICDKYKVKPEFLWEKYEGAGVFRNKKNNKWFGIIMNVDKSKITRGSGEIEVLDLKSANVSSEIKIKGIYEAYHMNKKNWISIILDDTLSDSEIIKYIDNSYILINK